MKTEKTEKSENMKYFVKLSGKECKNRKNKNNKCCLETLKNKILPKHCNQFSINIGKPLLIRVPNTLND